MKIKPKLVVTLSTLFVCILGMIAAVFIVDQPVNSSSEPEKSGFFKSSDAVIDAGTHDIIVSGKFSEAVANKDYLLTNDAEGTLTLTRISDKKTMKVSDSSHAHELKAVGDDFGYLQERGEAQYVIFLDPETGTSSPLQTEHSVISWDAIGTDISYHLYETTTLGFAQYDNKLGVNSQIEIDGNIATLSQMFVHAGNNYVWVVASKTENIIYSMDTHADVTKDFPVIQEIEEANGVLAEVVGDHWIITAPVNGSDKLFSQIWNSSGEMVFNMDITGYTFSGNAIQEDDSIYVPVSYTAGKTPDGLLIMNSEDHTTTFEDKMQGYVRE